MKVTFRPVVTQEDITNPDLLYCIKGRKELIIDCPDPELAKELAELPSEYSIPRYSDIVSYLVTNNHLFIELKGKSTTI